MNRDKNSQKGIALLSVLLALTMMTLLVSELTFSFRTQLRRTDSLQELDQARWYAQSTEDLAIKALKQDFKDHPDVTHLNEYWASQNVRFPVQNGEIKGQIKDMQGCFNVNALASPVETGKPDTVLDAFKELLINKDVDDVERIARATRNWVTVKSAAGQGAKDADYMGLPVPYLASHTLMRDVTEWRAVSGVSARVAQKVMPYLCAIPTSAMKVNVNTIPVEQPELLSALYGQSLPLEQARSVLKGRPKDGWKTVDDFTGQPLLANYSSTNASKMLTTVSSYFQMDAHTRYNSAEVRLRSLLVRDSENEFSVIRRKFGGV